MNVEVKWRKLEERVQKSKQPGDTEDFIYRFNSNINTGLQRGGDSLVLRQGKVDQAVARLWTGLEDILRAFIINVVASFRFTVSCETAKITTGLKPHQN